MQLLSPKRGYCCLYCLNLNHQTCFPCSELLEGANVVKQEDGGNDAHGTNHDDDDNPGQGSPHVPILMFCDLFNEHL